MYCFVIANNCKICVMNVKRKDVIGNRYDIMDVDKMTLSVGSATSVFTAPLCSFFLWADPL